jgi:hypothetical protein
MRDAERCVAESGRLHRVNYKTQRRRATG